MRKKTHKVSIANGGSAKGTQAIDRALSIMSQFDFVHKTWGAVEMSHKLGLTLPTTQRIMKTLEFKGFLAFDEEIGKFKIGLRVFELGAVVESQMMIVNRAKKVMNRLRDETNETIHLVVVDGDEMLYVKKVESVDAFGILSSVGIRRSLTTGSLGKAILSTFQNKMLKQYLSEHDLIQYTPRTITDKDRYFDEIVKTRERGFAIDREELFNGVCGIATPITEKHSAVGGVAIVFPALRYDEKQVSEWGQMIRQAGFRISHSLSVPLNDGRDH